MAGPLTVWGIDVGKSALKAIKLRLAPNKSVEAVAVDYLEHARIMSQQEADKEALWAAALEKFLSRNDISNDKVVVSVPGQQTLARFSKLPPVEKKKIPDIVRYEADQQIPFDMDEVVWDYQIFQAPDAPDVEVGIFAIKRELIRDYLRRFETGQIVPMAVQAAPLALYNGMQFDGAFGDGTVVLIDIGTENTDLLVATNDSLWTRTINVGGNNFTDALVKSFKLSFNKAEALKRTAATSKYARQIFQAMRPIFADLVQELQRSIGFYAATHRDAELTSIIGLGSAFKLPGLQKYVQQNLQFDLYKLDKFKRITIPATAEGQARDAANFAVAYGLALQGLSLAKVTSNLLPPEIAKQVVWQRKRPFFAATAACLLLAAGVIWFRGMNDKGTLAANAGNEQVRVSDYEQASSIVRNAPQSPPREYGRTILAAAQTFKRRHGELSSQGNEELEKIKATRELLENRALWLRIFEAVHAALPRPDGGLADATSADEYVAAIKKEAGTRRAKREEIFVESFRPVHSPRVDQEVIRDEWNAMTDVIASEGQQERPGFVITLTCRTPNEAKGVFVIKNFIEKLRQNGRREKQGFYINRVGLTGATETAGGGSQDAPAGRGQRGRGRTDDKPPPPREQSKVDPLTGEQMNTDWRFEVTFDVILQDLPERKDEKQTGESGGG